MSTIGTRLKQAREAQHKTRADVARETGILIHDLAALEYGSFDSLPDDETVAGFVRAYAECLGFRPDEPVAEFWTERGVESPPPAEEVGLAGGAPDDDEAAPVEAVEPTVPQAPALEADVPVEPPPPGDAASATRRTMPWGWLIAGTAAIILVAVAVVAMQGSRESPVVTPPADESTATRAPEPDIVAREPAATVEEPADAAPPPGGSATPAPSPAPADPAPADPAPAAASPTLRVTEFGVGTDVRNRRLIGESERFAPGRRVWFWTRVEGGSAGDEIRHVWIHEGREVATVELDVGSANWRTQSAKSLFGGSTGRWVVEARDASGRVLARSEFVCGS